MNLDIDLSKSLSVAGKGGMSNKFSESWFVGYTPDIIVGIYLDHNYLSKAINGFNENNKKKLTKLIFEEFIQSYLDENLIKKFYIPDGIDLIETNRKTGKRFNLISGQTILEAFVK